jgi:hypothetical protein
LFPLVELAVQFRWDDCKNKQRQEQRQNTGVLRCAQDDDLELTTASTTGEATANTDGL